MAERIIPNGLEQAINGRDLLARNLKKITSLETSEAIINQAKEHLEIVDAKLFLARLGAHVRNFPYLGKVQATPHLPGELD